MEKSDIFITRYFIFFHKGYKSFLCVKLALLNFKMAQSQLVRFWHHDDKWDATRGTFMFYIGRLRHEAEQQYQAHKEKSAISKIKERAAKFFTIMYNRRLSSGQAFKDDPDVKRIMKNIKLKYERSKTDSRTAPATETAPDSGANQPDSSTANPWQTIARSKAKAKATPPNTQFQELIDDEEPDGFSSSSDEAEDSDSDVSMRSIPIETRDDSGTDIDNVNTGRNWEPCLPLRRIGEYIQNLLEASLTGQPLEVIQITHHERCRNGFVSLCRLADVYGRGMEQDAMGPASFRWGTANLHKDWADYKILIEGSRYLAQYKGFDPIVCGAARRGFQRYNDHKRLLDHLRVSTDENKPIWRTFRKEVDRFLGDSHRQEYNEAAIANANGLMAMDTSAVMERQPLKVAQVKRYVPFSPLKPPETISDTNTKSGGKSKKKGSGKGKGAGKGSGGKNNNNNKKEEKNSGPPATEKKQNNKNSKKKENNNSNNENNNKKEKSKKTNCAWCYKDDHRSHNCKDLVAKAKWKTHKCKKCQGNGHPPSICPSYVSKE